MKSVLELLPEAFDFSGKFGEESQREGSGTSWWPKSLSTDFERWKNQCEFAQQTTEFEMDSAYLRRFGDKEELQSYYRTISGISTSCSLLH